MKEDAYYYTSDGAYYVHAHTYTYIIMYPMKNLPHAALIYSYRGHRKSWTADLAELQVLNICGKACHNCDCKSGDGHMKGSPEAIIIIGFSPIDYHPLIAYVPSPVHPCARSPAHQRIHH